MEVAPDPVRAAGASFTVVLGCPALTTTGLLKPSVSRSHGPRLGGAVPTASPLAPTQEPKLMSAQYPVLAWPL